MKNLSQWDMTWDVNATMIDKYAQYNILNRRQLPF